MGWPGVKSYEVFASAARTATAVSPVFQVPGGPGAGGQYKGLMVVVKSTAASSTPSVTFALQTSQDGGIADAWSAPSDLVSAAMTDADQARILIVHPGVADVTNVAAEDPLEGYWRVVATHADSDSITYSAVAYPIV